MRQITILLDPSVALFYKKIADNAGITLEKVLADTLFKVAAELSVSAIQNAK